MYENSSLQSLPLSFDIESKTVLKAATQAHKRLAELKGVVQSIPNQQILLNTLVLHEAKDSSAVENIITTHDELFKADLHITTISPPTKEVINYRDALMEGFRLVKKHRHLSLKHILKIQSILEKNEAGFRKVPGTVLKNPTTQELVYTPPQNADDIVALMSNLEKYINENDIDDVDPLVKMAVIHHQFESIHPFYDGNGRTGRIINILYLSLHDLLDIPILYLSRYIIKNKSEYYRLLQNVRDEHGWESWVLYMLEGVEQISIQTIQQIRAIRQLMQECKQQLRANYRFYSKDLLENLFKHPYTKIEYLQNDLQVSYATARNYLERLNTDGLLNKIQIGKYNYYINMPLLRLFSPNSK